MLFEMPKCDVFCDGAVGCRETPSVPEPAAPVVLAEMREFPLYLVR